jgi:hypothetical protein
VLLGLTRHRSQAAALIPAIVRVVPLAVIMVRAPAVVRTV